MPQDVHFAEDQEITLRRLQPKDVVAFQGYRCDPDVARYQDWAAMTDTEAAGFIAAMAEANIPNIGGWCQIAIAVQGDLVGDIGVRITADQSEAELGITLARSSQGQSIGYRAVQLVTDWIFAKTEVAKIVAITDQRNWGAQALLGRLGWPQIKTLGPDVEIVGLTEYVYEHQRPAF